MNGRRWQALLTFGLLLAVAVPAVAGGANGWQSFTDPTYGLRISIPASWRTVPPTVAGVRAEIERLVKLNQGGLASTLNTFIATPQARKQLAGYHFQAFQYLPKDPIQPDFALAFARTSAAVAGNMAAVSESSAKSYAAQPATVVTKHSVVQLPAGPAAFLEGTQTVQGLPVQFRIYVLGHDNLLYLFSFRADARMKNEGSAFVSIMHRFVFT